MKDLFTYNQKCNEIYIHYLLEAGLAHKKAIEGLSHIINAQLIWNARILGKEAQRDPHQMIALNQLFEQNTQAHKITQGIISELDLSNEITYTNSADKVFTNTIEEILQHVIIHSEHHRAQVGVLFKKFNIEPPATDYILYKRNSKKLGELI